MMVNKIHRKNSINILLAGLLLSSSCVRADIVADSGRPINFAGCRPYQTLYFSYTLDHTKAVELCRIAENVYRYTFGPIDKYELQVFKNEDDVGKYTSIPPAAGFAMYNEGYYYHLETTKIPRKGKFVTLVVSKGRLHGPQVAAIELANDYYGFQYGMDNYWLPDFKEKKTKLPSR